MTALEIRSDRYYRFPASRDEVWAAISAVDRYRHWWPWLRRFDGAGFEPGATWHCVVQPPLPYRVSFAVRLDEVEAPRLVTATVRGDVVGQARLELDEHPGGSQARLASSLAPGSGALRAFAAIARPLVRRGHDWVFDTGARQFAARLLG